MSFENRGNIPDKLLQPYNPAETEKTIYETWEQSRYFNPDICVEQGFTNPDAPTFSMVLPPPNVTGRLHLGHALEHSLQDAVVRFERMRGKRTLWIPGTDHAAIATQARYEKESGLKRHDYPRDEFFNMIQEFGLKNQADMQQQMRLFGSSLDWSREAFTLDEKRSVAVRTAFKQMYDDGLIYRGYRIVNWDPKGQTTISDDEIVYEERDAKLYTFKYWADFPVSISTTRPETKVGDTAVAVHPDDTRYKEFVGKTYEGIFCGVALSIKIVADESVEPEFGTGALGVTPAHSPIDWDIAQRHNLKVIPVINEYAKMTIGNDDILNKKTTEAREIIVEWLRSEGLLEKEETVKQNISTAERTGGIVEPLPKLQWFVNVTKPIESKGGKTLKDLMLEPITSGEIAVMPDRYGKVYENWVTNLRDWCISRQIIYGHQIPVWYKGEEIYSGITAPEGEGWMQDPDTLDTWFSSGLWTFSTLGWPITKLLGFNEKLVESVKNGSKETTMRLTHYNFSVGDVCKLENTQTKELFGYAKITNIQETILGKERINEFKEYYPDKEIAENTPAWQYDFIYSEKSDLELYHPTNLMNPGYEIIFFWVARMVMMGNYLLGMNPFKTVYLHGIVRDTKGVKFSKSLKNGIEPEEIIKKYGTDALRMAMVVGVGPGNDLNFDEQKVKAYGKFANKIWNATRFVLENISDLDLSKSYELDTEDQASQDELNALIKEITAEMEEYKFYLVSEKLYHYFWHTFADIIIERSKTKISEGKNIESAKYILYVQLTALLKLLHPFMPFVTEEIWGLLPKTNSKKLLIIETWPASV